MTHQAETAAKLIQISAGLYVRQEIDNMGWADMGANGIFVVDALEHAELEDEVMSSIANTIPDKHVSIVFNTHTHYDHVALNAAFKKKHGAEIINRKTRDIPEDGLEFEGGDRSCCFMPVPGGHTADDCVVWFPDDSVLFVGDLFGWGLITSMNSATSEVMTGLEAIYNRLIDFGAENVVPGHGPLCSTAELERCRDYHDWLTGEVYSGVENGVPARDLAGAIPVPEDMRNWWRLEEWKHEQNIRKLIKGARRA